MQKLYKPEQVFLYFITGRHIIFYCFITYIVVHSFCNIRIVWLVIKRIKLTLFYPIATQISLKYRIYIPAWNIIIFILRSQLDFCTYGSYFVILKLTRLHLKWVCTVYTEHPLFKLDLCSDWFFSFHPLIIQNTLIQVQFLWYEGISFLHGHIYVLQRRRMVVLTKWEQNSVTI